MAENFVHNIISNLDFLKIPGKIMWIAMWPISNVHHLDTTTNKSTTTWSIIKIYLSLIVQGWSICKGKLNVAYSCCKGNQFYNTVNVTNYVFLFKSLETKKHNKLLYESIPFLLLGLKNNRSIVHMTLIFFQWCDPSFFSKFQVDPITHNNISQRMYQNWVM